LDLRWLSCLPNETSALSKVDVGRYSFGRLRRNLETLRESPVGISDESRYLTNLARDYEHALQDPERFCRIENDPILRSVAPIAPPDAVTSVDYLQKVTARFLENANGGPLICISPSHGTTSPVLKACYSINPGMNIGVICVDAHADLYDSRIPPWKGNVFSRLLEEETISFLGIIGVPAFRRESIESTLSAHIAGRCLIYTEDVTDGEMSEIARRFCEAGVTHMYCSIDPDGLDTRSSFYTAMEYCAFTNLINAGIHDLNGLNSEGLTEAVDNILRPLNPFQGGRRNLFRIGQPGLSLETVSRRLNTFYSALRGHVLPFLDCNVPVVGDIVELGGPDYEGRTREAVITLAKSLLFSYSVAEGGDHLDQKGIVRR